MPTSDPMDILLQHDHWATRQILLACEKLTPEQFARKFEIGPGSLQATITHMIAAMKAWTESLAGKANGPRIDQGGAVYSPAELLPLLEQATAEFMMQAKAAPLDQLAKREREGKTFVFTRAVILTHVATHGMHHRAQCLNMLKQLGVKPLPPSSVAEWSRNVDFVQ